TVVNLAGETIPVRLAAVALCDERATSETAAGRLGTAVIAQDLRTIKQLEHDKLEAERLAAVGQTVAGLAHGIKNILTGLEGGMYVTSTGLARADHGRIERGFGMLERNMGRIGSLARDLLAFSRGDRPHPDLVDPAAILREVVELFAENAGQHGIRIVTEITGRFAPASLDAEGIHSCLANLVSNAIDACLVSDRVPAAIAETEAPDQLPTNGSDRESAASGHRRCTITARLVEVDETLVYEIADTGCGMDYEIKQKVFTSFFTTKSTGGTGLGLLTTRKIVQQHGGTIDFESTPGEGTTFRIRFQRRRLPVPEDNEPPAEGGRSHGENHATAR
ncbi:MAG: ATP-binding protein, partial [Candidatus Eiseniibacteriota bacterium]